MRRFILLFIGLFFISCFKDKTMTEEYFKAQSRDENIIGNWILISEDENVKIIYSFNEKGEFKIIQSSIHNYFYYTNNNKLYVLRPGSWKESAVVDEYQYSIVGDKMTKRSIFNGKISEYEDILVRHK